MIASEVNTEGCIAEEDDFASRRANLAQTLIIL